MDTIITFISSPNVFRIILHYYKSKEMVFSQKQLLPKQDQRSGIPTFSNNAQFGILIVCGWDKTFKNKIHLHMYID